MTHDASPAQQHSPKHTLSIGGATFDLFLHLHADATHECHGTTSFLFPFGAKIGVKDVIGTCGGGANNTAVGLSRLGCHAAFSGVLGDDQWGQSIQENFKRERVDTRYMSIIEQEPSNFSLILQSKNGERTILSHKSMDRHFHDVTFDRDAIQTVDAIYLNHIHEDSCEIENDIVDALISTPSIHLTWNPGGCQIESGIEHPNNRNLLRATNILLLNKEEALAFTKTTTTLQAFQRLIEAGARMICITDGAHGSSATDGTHLYHCPTLPCNIVDATGAGDAFGTAVTWAIMHGKNLPTALKAGTINATSVIGAIGAQDGLLTDIQINSMLKDTLLDVSIEPLTFF